MNQQHHVNPELRAERARLRAPIDLLAYRQGCAAYWTAANDDNPAYGLNHARVFYRKSNFRYLLLPRTRARVQAKHDAAKAAFRQQLRESMDRDRLRKQLKASPTLQLFT